METQKKQTQRHLLNKDDRINKLTQKLEVVETDIETKEKVLNQNEENIKTMELLFRQRLTT